MKGDDGVDAGYGVFGGVAGDALVDYAIVIAAGGEEMLQVRWVALVDGVQAVAGGDAVAEADEGFFGWCGGEGSCDEAGG